MKLSTEYCRLITRLKLQAKVLGINVQVSRMTDKSYALAIVEEIEGSSDLETLVLCQEIKDFIPKNAG